MPASFPSLFLVIAVPVVVLMTVWATVMLGRVLFPKRLKWGRREVRETPSARGERIESVRSRDIVEDLHKQTAHSVEEEPHVVEDARQEFEPLFGDLWLRRN